MAQVVGRIGSLARGVGVPEVKERKGYTVARGRHYGEAWGEPPTRRVGFRARHSELPEEFRKSTASGSSESCGVRVRGGLGVSVSDEEHVGRRVSSGPPIFMGIERERWVGKVPEDVRKEVVDAATTEDAAALVVKFAVTSPLYKLFPQALRYMFYPVLFARGDAGKVLGLARQSLPWIVVV